MAVDNGDFVRVNFTGKVKETDEQSNSYCCRWKPLITCY